jgi:hypothetical protein
MLYITMMAGEAKSQMGDSPYSKMLDNSHLAGSYRMGSRMGPS